jgi:hypothetical protein
MAQFVLSSIDTATGCFLEQAHFVVSEPGVPARILGLDTMNEETSIELDPQRLRELAQAFILPLQHLGNGGELHRLGDRATFNPHSHTGRELLLMLNGQKPFAAFSVAVADSDMDEIIPRDYFEPHIRNGTILMKEHVQKVGPRTPHEVLYVLYALPGEEWRFDAYIALWDLAAVHGWNEGFEKLQGYLLGYETAIDPFFKGK